MPRVAAPVNSRAPDDVAVSVALCGGAMNPLLSITFGGGVVLSSVDVGSASLSAFVADVETCDTGEERLVYTVRDAGMVVVTV